MNDEPTLEDCERVVLWLADELWAASGRATGGDAAALKLAQGHAQALCDAFRLMGSDNPHWRGIAKAITDDAR